jgi:hypothetical protein
MKVAALAVNLSGQMVVYGGEVLDVSVLVENGVVFL